VQTNVAASTNIDWVLFMGPPGSSINVVQNPPFVAAEQAGVRILCQRRGRTVTSAPGRKPGGDRNV
jgi:hypothetical protein